MPPKGSPGTPRDTSRATAAAAERNRILAAGKRFDETEGVVLDQQLAQAQQTEHLDEYVAAYLRDIVRDTTCGFKYPSEYKDYDGDEPVITDITTRSFTDALVSMVLDWSDQHVLEPLSRKLIERAVECACKWFPTVPEDLLTKEFVDRAQRALTNGLDSGSFIGPKRPVVLKRNFTCPECLAAFEAESTDLVIHYDFKNDKLSKTVHLQAPMLEELKEKIRQTHAVLTKQSEEDSIRQKVQREFEEHQAQLQKSQEEMMKQILDLQKLRNLTGGPDSPFRNW